MKTSDTLKVLNKAVPRESGQDAAPTSSSHEYVIFVKIITQTKIIIFK